MSIEAPATRRPTNARWALFMLLVIYILNFLDRQIVTILAAPIKADLQLTNTELGLVSGLAFALFYTTLGLPIAYLADRANRVWILSISCALWSGMTALCGAVSNFGQLFLARVGVGIGEAGCVPTAHSLISDLFPAERRSTALAIFAMGIPLGSLLGLGAGGYVAEHHGWRAAFLVVGLPGLLVALVMILTVREPSRPPAAPWSNQVSLGALLRSRAFVRLCAGAAATSAAGYGLLAFIGVYAAERFGMGLGAIGIVLGVVVGVAGALGSFSGGALADRAATARGRLFPASVSLIVSALALPVALLSAYPIIAFAILFVVSYLNAFWYGPTFAGIQGLASPKQRAMAAAVFTFVVNAIGLGTGPLAVGVIADTLARTGLNTGFLGTSPLALAMVCVGMLNMLAAWSFWGAFERPGTQPTRHRRSTPTA